MKARLRVNETAVAAASRYFEQAKAARARAVGLAKGIADLEAKLRELEEKAARQAAAKAPAMKVRSWRKREWFEAYRWFTTIGGKLVIGGRDAKQNENLVAHHLDKNDLFFHADIAGGSVVILKDGEHASEQDKKEAAQWAACYSKAWKLGYTSLDVYAVGKEQVSKTPPSGEYLAKGSFAISGKRMWFRSTPLQLYGWLGPEGTLKLQPVLPAANQVRLRLIPGELTGKGAEQAIKKALGLDSLEGSSLGRLPGPIRIVQEA